MNILYESFEALARMANTIAAMLCAFSFSLSPVRAYAPSRESIKADLTEPGCRSILYYVDRWRK